MKMTNTLQVMYGKLHAYHHISIRGVWRQPPVHQPLISLTIFLIRVRLDIEGATVRLGPLAYDFITGGKIGIHDQKGNTEDEGGCWKPVNIAAYDHIQNQSTAEAMQCNFVLSQSKHTVQRKSISQS